MASQSLLLDLEEGDRVQVSHIDLLVRPLPPFHQVYVYTFTGLHDKGANHLTQFLGIMLRPKAPPFLALEDEPTGR